MKRAVLLFGLALFIAAPVAAGTLQIENRSRQDILNIFVQPSQKGGKSFFMRLDMSPGAKDSVENPECRGNLRVDTGLEFWSYEGIDLASAKKLIFGGKTPAGLTVVMADGGSRELAGGVSRLVPLPGDKPVCGLDRFRPKMPMKDVCSILAPNIPTDDNGALITGLGFAGLVWAARLAPEQKGQVSGESRLEHLELRRPLNQDEVFKILQTLYRQGYVPWQAEFPGKDLDFAKDRPESREIVRQAIEAFLARPQKNPAPNPRDEEPEASILLAPQAILPALEDADSPREDVQLFTLILKPATATLYIDVAAYAGNEEQAGAD